MKNFFISYNRADQAWAEWVAWILEEEKYSVIIEAWDFLPGENFVLEMHKAAIETERTVAILSQNYLDAEYTHPEWAAAFALDPQGQRRKLIPIRVGQCEPTGLLGALIHIDVIGLPKQEARDKILKYIKKERIKPGQAPGFPGGELQRALARVAPKPVKYPNPVDDKPPPGLLKRVRNLSRRKRILLASAVIILSLISTLGTYLYYWRCGVIRASKGISVITFDQLNKADWKLPKAEGYDLSGHWLTLKQIPNLIFLKDHTYFDFRMTIQLKLTNEEGAAWAVRAKDENNYYLFYLAHPKNERQLTPGLYFYIVRGNRFDPGNSQKHVDSSIAERLTVGRQYEIRVEVTGRQIENFITPGPAKGSLGDSDGGKQVSLGKFEDPNNTFPCGSIGFRTVGSGQFSLRQVYVQPTN